MLSRRALKTAARSAKPALRTQSQIPRASFSAASSRRADPYTPPDDPDMNGGYINPPAIKRSNRDPYGWDMPQQRRNFGEPVHEDDDILGTFTLHDYNHMTTAQASACWGVFISCILAITYYASWSHPERPSWPKEYEGGLQRELGGHGAVRAFKEGDRIESLEEKRRQKG